MSDSYICRIAAQLGPDAGGGWVYRNLNIKTIGVDCNHKVRTFDPILVRAIAEDVGLDFTLPTIQLDFGQWDETLVVKCFYEGAQKNVTEALIWWSQFRAWLRYIHVDPYNRLFLQLFVMNPDYPAGPSCALDPISQPLTVAVPGMGWRGSATGITLDNFDAGKGVISYTLKWKHGLVVPI